MVNRLLLMGLVGLGLAPLSMAEEPAALVARLETERFQAMQAVDLKSLDRLLAPDLSYTHSSGVVDTKASFIEAIRAGTLKYVTIAAPEDVRVLIYDSTAVVTGHLRLTVVLSGQDVKLHLRYTDVWARRTGEWQMVAWHSTKLAEP